MGWSEPQTLTSPPSATSVTSGVTSFTFLVFNDVGQENAVLFDDVCPPYCPGGWTFEPYTANSTKLLKHLMAEHEARLGLLVGDVAYANGYLVRLVIMVCQGVFVTVLVEVFSCKLQYSHAWW